jgi:signal transduction histidine kinase
MRILVVDDDPNVLKSLTALLGHSGYEYFSAATGEEALEAGENDAFDLVLLDVMMPGMSGLEVCRRLKAQHDNFLPVILVTARDSTQGRVEGLDAGADDYVVKPFDNRELLARVKALLRIKALHDEVRTLALVREQVVYTVSHDFRTPLVGIRGAIQNLLSGLVGEVSDDQREYLELVDQAAGRLAELTDQMCQVAKAKDGLANGEISREAVDVEKAVQTAVSGLRPQILKQGLKLEVDAEEDLLAAWGERDAVTQLLANLVDNAIKHSPRGGRVGITIREKSTNRGPHVHVIVSDEGPGIARSDFERIFFRFEQVGDPEDTVNLGTGMGLAICKGIIDSHGGTIWIESEPGAGARFHFTLPGVAPVRGAV